MQKKERMDEMTAEWNSDMEQRFEELVERSRKSGRIDPALYTEYDVKRGLRDSTGKGVLTGLTEISDVMGFGVRSDGQKVPIDGELFYQGYNVGELIKGFENRRFGFEEVTYLLLFGELPNKKQLREFIDILSYCRELPEEFTRDVIMKAPSANMMNSLQKCVLTLYSYDEKPEDTSITNILWQELGLIAKMPLLAVYSYHKIGRASCRERV